MSKKPEIPDTYIDPWTGEEKKVQCWDADNDVPLNSPYWAGNEHDGLDLPEDQACDLPENKETHDWNSKKSKEQLLWFYVAVGLLFVLVNFWIFRGGLF